MKYFKTKIIGIIITNILIIMVNNFIISNFALVDGFIIVIAFIFEE